MRWWCSKTTVAICIRMQPVSGGVGGSQFGGPVGTTPLVLSGGGRTPGRGLVQAARCSWVHSILNLALSPFVCLLGIPQTDEGVCMSKNDVSTYAGTTIMLTVEGWLALAADALAAAEKARSKQGRKRLCEKAMNHLRSAARG